ncbi:hypothetical protein Y032_0005g2454 [Ancylostoma ceylanicum]|uniref:Uncharacterized protein n=1 Tax=Ancylostoma ceylanicum TaxID=53326 RepID=A0A016VSV7_9BILA|nr:hypothetical protein Y032_0005g2454 [Ancylostoma ceylanicum]
MVIPSDKHVRTVSYISVFAPNLGPHNHGERSSAITLMFFCYTSLVVLDVPVSDPLAKFYRLALDPRLDYTKISLGGGKKMLTDSLAAPKIRSARYCFGKTCADE